MNKKIVILGLTILFLAGIISAVWQRDVYDTYGNWERQKVNYSLISAINFTGERATFTNDVTAAYFFGNGSQLTGIVISETDPLWSANFTLYNSSWSSTYNSTYNLWAYNQTTPANAYTDIKVGTANLHTHDTLNLTNLAGLNSKITLAGENITSGTVAFARLPTLTDTHTHNALNITTPTGLNNKLTLSMNNITDNTKNYWNSTFATFNKTYADTLYSTINEPLWSANFTLYNASWSSTYNASYVPYTGASSNLNLGNYNITTKTLKVVNNSVTWNIYVNSNGTLVFEQE